MERLDRNRGSLQCPLQKAPEVLQTIRVDVALHVFDGAIDRLMTTFTIQTFIRCQGICEDFGSRFHMPTQVRLKLFLLSSGDSV